jgi:hypothetical protein
VAKIGVNFLGNFGSEAEIFQSLRDFFCERNFEIYTGV